MVARSCVAAVAILAVFAAGGAEAVTQNFGAAKDTYVWNAAVTHNLGAQTIADVGRGTGKGGVQIKRAFLNFDIAPLPGNATITSAKLRLFVDRTTSDPLGLVLKVWRLQGTFVEGDNLTGVTWDSQPGVETSPTSTASISTLAGDWAEIDVTTLVAAERTSSHPNAVWLRLAAADETMNEDRAFAFRTKEHGSGIQRAELLVVYSLPTATPTATASSTGTLTPSATPTATATTTKTATSTATATASSSATPRGIVITSPLGGSVQTGEIVWVRGTLHLPSHPMVGVAVNGAPGLVEGNQFVAAVPVSASTTNLTATARDFSGTLAADSVSVTCQPGPSDDTVRLTAAPAGGTPPLTTSFHVSSLVGIQHVALDADNDGTIDVEAPSIDSPLSFVFAQSGLYAPHVTVTDTAGMVRSASTIVAVADPVAIEVRLQATWSGLKDALRGNDTTAALQFVHSDRVAGYQALWAQIPTSALADIDSTLTSIQAVKIEFGSAEYEMLRNEGGQTFSYPVRFRLDHDGLWRLADF